MNSNNPNFRTNEEWFDVCDRLSQDNKKLKAKLNIALNIFDNIDWDNGWTEEQVQNLIELERERTNVHVIEYSAVTALEAKLEKATFIIEKIMGGPLTKEQYDFFKNLQSIWESKCLAELEDE